MLRDCHWLFAVTVLLTPELLRMLGRVLSRRVPRPSWPPSPLLFRRRPRPPGRAAPELTITLAANIGYVTQSNEVRLRARMHRTCGHFTERACIEVEPEDPAEASALRAHR